MRNLVRSPGYARTRVGIGAISSILGIVVLFRTFTSVGVVWAALPAYVLGGALVVLGIVRYGEYRAWRSRR